MSEDSIASDSISCRSEVSAPLLPPRKRLLAGLKQNGWPSPSSSSCAPAAHGSSQAKETLAQAFATKTEDLDQSSGDGDAADGGSLQSLSGAAESLDSDTMGERKPNRQRTPSPLTVRKFSKKKKKSASPNSDEHLYDGAVAGAKASMVADTVKQYVSSKISLEVEEITVGRIEGEVFAEEKEERATTANGEASAGHDMDLKLGPNHGSVYKEDEEVTCEEAHKQSRNLSRKTKMDIKQVVKTDDTKKGRKMSLRQKQSKEKEAARKKLKMQYEKLARTPLPLADEELARQLHRAMNSSPRIARCLTPKEEKPLQASSWKHFSSS